jgi:phosphoglycerate dehydrogenase-like enzyme
MKRTAYLINVGRGVLVQLDALVEALKRGSVAGAALDVFETEPLPKDHPLWDMESVIITPHVAGNSPTVASNHLAVMLANIGRFRAGQPLLNVVDKERWF